jgi:hypothetical protein
MEKVHIDHGRIGRTRLGGVQDAEDSPIGIVGEACRRRKSQQYVSK